MTAAERAGSRRFAVLASMDSRHPLPLQYPSPFANLRDAAEIASRMRHDALPGNTQFKVNRTHTA